jgi:pimeloyl-ACP methyl ester carboxylesterase
VAVERELVTLAASDGAVHDALFHLDERALRRRERRTGRRTAVVHAHGVMGNFLVGTLRFLPAALAHAGYPTLVLETRLANIGQLFGEAIFDDALLDLEAGEAWLRERGFESLVMAGYSSGATLATRYVAARTPENLRGLVCLGNPWGLPQSSERRSDRFGATPSYQELAELIEGRIAGDPVSTDRIVVIACSRGPGHSPAASEVYTHRTWWHTRGPQAHAAMAHRQIIDVRAPILLVQGTSDEVVYPEEAERLASVARAAGNEDVEVVWIEGADHAFSNRDIPTIDAVVRWLDPRA